MSIFPTISTQATEPQPPSVWHNRNYVVLFLSGILLAVGGKVYELALPLLLYTLSHHSAVAMTTMRAIEFLPNLLLAMFIGVWVDRVDKRRWMVAVIAVQVTLLLLLYTTYLLGAERLWVYYLAGFGLMTCQYAYGNARMSITKLVLPGGLLAAANANFSFLSTFVGICGPAITGVLLMMSDLHTGLLLTLVAYLVSWAVIGRLSSPEVTHKPTRSTSFWQDLHEGWTTLRAHRMLWQMTILVIFLNSTGGMVDAISIFYGKDHLHLANVWLGLVFAVEGIGGLLGSRLVGWSHRTLGVGRTLGLTMLLMGVCFGLPIITGDVVLFAVALFGIGFFSTIQSVCIWTFRQETTPSELIGRISGLTGSIFKVGMVWTIFGSGWLMEWCGPWAVYGGACVANFVLVGIYWRLPLRRLK